MPRVRKKLNYKRVENLIPCFFFGLFQRILLLKNIDENFNFLQSLKSRSRYSNIINKSQSNLSYSTVDPTDAFACCASHTLRVYKIYYNIIYAYITACV